jgi:hypothetical protein
MIAVIQTVVYPNAYNEHPVWGAILVLLLTRGPGVVSLDLSGQMLRQHMDARLCCRIRNRRHRVGAPRRRG